MSDMSDGFKARLGDQPHRYLGCGKGSLTTENACHLVREGLATTSEACHDCLGAREAHTKEDA